MLDGTTGVLVSLAVNPNVALPDGGSRLFQSAFLIVASDPAADMVPFHELDTVSSLASTQLTVQPNSVDVVGLVTVTWPWKPPGQVFVPMHFARTNQLTDAVFDPYSRQPSYKWAAVEVRLPETWDPA